MRPTGPSSAEVIDDRMIIRPAAKALPLSTALRVARGRGSRPGDNPLEGTASLSPRPMPQVPPAPLSDSNGDAPRSGGRVSDGQRSKARDLFELAMRDREAGRSSSAKMNARLATIYDPENEQYRRALAEWEEPGGSSSTMQAAPVSPSQASQVSAVAKRPDYVLLYEEAQTCEEQGDIDRALELLRQGIEQFPSAAAFHNRLGVLLAMKKRDFDAAADAIQRAIELEPENLHYKSNFGKIIQRARQRPRSEPAIRVRAQEP
jgi:predicted Zn-dependent protease